MIPAFTYRGKTLLTSPSGVLEDEFVQTDDNTYALPAWGSSGTTTATADSQSWTSGSSPSELTGVVARFTPGAGPTLWCRVRLSIYAHSGTYGTSSVPTGAPLVSSEWYALDGGISAAADFWFPLSGWTPSPNTQYTVVAEYEGQPMAGLGSYLPRRVYEEGAEATHGGNAARKTFNGFWVTTGIVGRDMTFKVYSVSGGGGGGGGADLRARVRGRGGWL